MSQDIDKKGILKQAVYRLLLPLVRLMVANGLTYREFCDMMKLAYYDTGVTILKHDGKKTTESQLSLLTGLHRKDISVLANEKTQDRSFATIENQRSVCAAIVAEWISNQLYLDKKGSSIPLPYNSDGSKSVSFTTLAESISTDVRPKAFLSELERLDLVAVSLEKNPTITLKKEAFLPSSDFKEKVGFLSRNIGDHIAAAVSNTEGVQPAFFERSAFHNGLSRNDVQSLQKMLNEDGMGLLKKIYWQADNAAGAAQNGDDKLRMTCGIYFYAEAEEQE